MAWSGYLCEQVLTSLADHHDEIVAGAPDDLDPAQIAADLRAVAADELGPVFARS